MTKTSPLTSSGVQYGWFCTCLHDFPEPEGIVLFARAPIPGDVFRLPSSGFTEDWQVGDVNAEDMSFTAIPHE